MAKGSAEAGAETPSPGRVDQRDDSPQDGARFGGEILPRCRRRFVPTLLGVLAHLLCLVVYLRPLTRPHPYNPDLVGSPRPVLDESHIMSEENKDARGTAPLEELWRNDYWGRPMDSPSSHKSWRPLTVLSFRWLKMEWLGRVLGWDELFVHRLVNVLVHATVAELAGLLSTKMFPDLGGTKSLVMRFLTKMLFALHPTHVECTANAANRPHILALMAMAIACDPDLHLVLCMLAVAVGLLSSETAIFQLPAIVVTMTIIRWRQGAPKYQVGVSSIVNTALSLVPRYFVVISIGLSYLAGRYMFDTLSIPDGLIRPAENPFYALTGLERALTYSLVLSAHIGKAVLVDPVGFSHEYGFDCVRKVITASPIDDMRLFIPIGLVLGAVLVTCECALEGIQASANWLVLLAWFTTLFSVSGFIKVGTSIADRIAVPSTFAVALLGGRALAEFILDIGTGWFSSDTASRRKNGLRPIATWTVLKSLLVFVGLAKLWLKVDHRASEWMDSVPLLESSLISCPRSAKSNLEMSKIYSGLYPEKFDLRKALSYLEKVEEIDPNYCDVHQQFGHCFVQQGRYLEFEERLTKALMCPFTMGGSLPLWQQYWKAVTSDPATGAEAKRRMDKYQKILEEAVQKETEKEIEKHRTGGRDEL